MSNFFEIFNPGQRYLREQLETEKLLVVQDDQGGSGPDPLDLESGSVVLRMPPHAGQAKDETEPGSTQGADVYGRQ